jgi:hypothetical protein
MTMDTVMGMRTATGIATPRHRSDGPLPWASRSTPSSWWSRRSMA